MSGIRRAAAVLVTSVLLLLGLAVPAFAHAALLQSTPADGVIVDAAPSEVLLQFNEAVSTSLGSVKVLSPTGTRVDTGRVSTRDDRKTVVVPLRAELAKGTYLVAWRVVSEDSHPVSGASTFSVRSVSAVAAAPASRGSGIAAWLLGLSRFVAYVGLLLLVGAIAFVTFVGLPARKGDRLRLVTGAALIAAAAGTGCAVLMQGPYAAALPLSHSARPALIRDVVSTRYGTALAVRLGVLLVMAVLLRGWVRAPRRSVGTGLLVLSTAALLATSWAGHAGVGDLAAVALPLDVVHLAAAAAWAGGLGLLVLVVLPAGDESSLRRLLPRWSRLATISVAALVATGLFASWREVRELGALTPTAYGRELMAKTGLVVAMIALGARGRTWVRRYAGGDPAARPGVSRLRRSVALEAAIALVVIGVTAVLVETTPARTAFAPTFVAHSTVAGGLGVEVQVEPARVGVNAIHVYFAGAGGKAVDVEEVTAVLTRVGTDDRVDVAVPHESLGHYEQTRVVLPFKGSWRIELTTRTSDIDSTTRAFTFRVR